MAGCAVICIVIVTVHKDSWMYMDLCKDGLMHSHRELHPLAMRFAGPLPIS